MAEYTSAGLTTRSQSEVLAEVEADQRADVSADLDLSTSSPHGQINQLLSRAIRLGEEALAALYAAIDPDSATGDALLRLCAITGTIREPATSSRVTVPCTFTVGGTYAAGTLAVAPSGRPGDRFVNAEDVVIGAPGTVDVVFKAEETGPVQAPADTLAIASPVAGWASVGSHDDADLGSEIESEGALRQRRNAEVESPGSSSVGGIAADITRELSDVISCFVVENDTASTVDSIPPFSIEVVVFGPTVPTTADDDAVASQILASKAAGVGTYGTTTRTVLDSQGLSHAVSFTRPSTVTISVALTIATNASTYAGDDAVVSKIVERAAETFVPGLDASWSQIVAWAHEVPGVLRVSAFTLNGSPADVAITSRQIARISSINVAITSAPATP